MGYELHWFSKNDEGTKYIKQKWNDINKTENVLFDVKDQRTDTYIMFRLRSDLVSENIVKEFNSSFGLKSRGVKNPKHVEKNSWEVKLLQEKTRLGAELYKKSHFFDYKQAKLLINNKIIRKTFSEQGMPEFDGNVDFVDADSNYEAVEVHIEKKVSKRTFKAREKYVLEFSDLQLKADIGDGKWLTSSSLNLEASDSFYLTSRDLETTFSEFGCDIDQFNSRGGENILQGGYPTFVTWFVYDYENSSP